MSHSAPVSHSSVLVQLFSAVFLWVTTVNELSERCCRLRGREREEKRERGREREIERQIGTQRDTERKRQIDKEREPQSKRAETVVGRL